MMPTLQSRITIGNFLSSEIDFSLFDANTNPPIPTDRVQCQVS